MIAIEGAREHNLRNVSLELPRERLVVLTGVSGSGKSALAFNTLYTEGQRRYLGSLSAKARSLFEQWPRPRCDRVRGLAPAIAIEARHGAPGPRATVGTLAEIDPLLRLLWARLGTSHCPRCGRALERSSSGQIASRLGALPEGTRLTLLAPLVRDLEGDHTEVLERALRDGFVRAQVDGETIELRPGLALSPAGRHSIDLVVDRIVVKPGVEARISGSVETALAAGGGELAALVGDRRERHAEAFACPDCRLMLDEPVPASFNPNSPRGMCPTCTGLGVVPEGEAPCSACDGERLHPAARAARLADLGIAALRALPIVDAARWLAALSNRLTPAQREVAREPLAELAAKLGRMVELGLDHLALGRAGPTLSGGEIQRVRLAGALGGELSGVLYLLDEPTTGLHPRDTERLVAMLLALRDLGNTVIAVEHDAAVIRAADWCVDFGPLAGTRGGDIVYQGPPSALAACATSLTGRYLAGPEGEPDRPPRGPAKHVLAVRGARAHNLAGIDVDIPLERLVALTGVSGAGKTTLALDVVLPALGASAAGTTARCGTIEGAHRVARAVVVDRASLASSGRSNPATYLGLYDEIRALFAQQKEARIRGFDASRFSFNRKGGRCEACAGAGVVAVAMELLPDVLVTCEACAGRRFNDATLRVRYRGHTIADVLAMTADEALVCFAGWAPIAQVLSVVAEVGLGYLPLGQSAATLSGGETQRLKLARELSRPSGAGTLIVLDEPTVGLHPHDVALLVALLHRLVDGGASVLAIEHDLGLVARADHVIDLGPEGGAGGGRVVATGPPAAIARVGASHTGRALAARASRDLSR